jgi:hypothetical protein
MRLTELREAVIPLELALANDPEVTSQRSTAAELPTLEQQGGPPHKLAQYLAAEQRLGRIRPGIDTTQAAIVLLAALFGLSANPLTRPGTVDTDTIATAVTMMLDGIAT